MPRRRVPPSVPNPPRKFAVIRRAGSPSAAHAHPMQRALVEAARRVADVLAGKSLAAGDLQHLTPPEFRRDVHDLVYGTLRAYGQGDAILDRLVQRPPDALVRALLLVALYRLDGRPDSEHVVVDQAVDAAGELTERKAGGFVNAILRNYQRQRADLAETTGEQPIVRHRFPAWWLARLQQAYPNDWPAVVAAGNAAPPLSLRVNVRRANRPELHQRLKNAGVAAETIEGFPSALSVPIGTRIDTLPGYGEGDFAVQDPGAQRAAEWLAPRAGERVLDACAAPGGKTGHLLEIADCRVLALDNDAARCRRVEENLARLGHLGERFELKTADASRPEAWWDGQPFDCVLADVPCTASGVVRRHPDVKWLRREEDIARFARIQAGLLRALWPTLRPGGRLLYATCSIFPEENHLQISEAVAALPGAVLLRQEQLLPNDRHDGFFYGLLEKSLA